jgi:tetratricopeptide (TPR) repeat protein
MALLAVVLLWQRGWGAVQRNRAFVTLNHRPTLFETVGGRDEELAMVEQQLLASPQEEGTQRMLALVQRAKGEQPAHNLAAEELVWWGQQREQAGELAAARYLYQWAVEVEPAWSDGWYYLGNSYETEKEWAAAEASYRQAIVNGRFSTVGIEATTHYRLGEVLLWQVDDAAAAVPFYQKAVALMPADHWARLRLGYALYWSGGDAGAAEREILAAIEQWPNERYLKWPYFYLGDLYRDAGRIEEAATAYERVLALDPTDEQVQERLAALGGR